ncbi:MAG: hypothetical protein H0T92_00405 [Pyrinomonadaceae bacterium]|nr:hypothetical protein [Pyrinomonadaceae bacterium]
MDVITLRAHFDGNRILLDEPFELEPDTKLIVTVLPKRRPDTEREAWLLLSGGGLAAAYGEDEAEYSLHLIKEANPDYERG